MFTGLIETTGTVRSLTRSGGGARLSIEVDWTDGATPTQGDSIAVNGACLTVLDPTPRTFAADLSPETLNRTLLGELRPGSTVNLERALRLGDRFGDVFARDGRLERFVFDADPARPLLVAQAHRPDDREFEPA